jgi:curli biogenesis system outer membrane secretion channel CsgG
MQRFSMHLALLAVLAPLAASGALRAQAPAEKPRLAIRAIAATPAVQAQAKSEGTDNALMQVEQGADPQLMDAIQATRRFDLVARSDMPSVMKEQDLTQSGNVNVMDPQAARAFQLAGARYVATVTIGNFQDISERTELLNQFGTSKAERRTIDLQATVKIFDTTTGTLYRSTTVTISEAATNEIMPGVEQKGSKTNVVLGQAAARLAREAAASIADSISPARVVGYTMGKITFNRSADQGVAAGQVYEVFSMGEAMVDPDTGEQLGAEEVSVGWARVTDAGARVSTAQAIEDRGIDRGAVLRLRPDGLPAGVNPDGKATGSAAGGTNAPGAPANAAPSAPGVSGSPATGAFPSGGAPATGGSASAAARPLRLAIFVKQRPGCIPEEKVPVFEDLVTAAVSGPATEIIRREDVVNAVNRFARAGANAGTAGPDAETVDRLLSDRTSASQLAAQMGADLVLTASISQLQTAKRRLDDPSTGTATDVEQWTLIATYGVLDGATGASKAAGTVQADFANRSTRELKVEVDAIDQVLRDAAVRMGPPVRAAIESGRVVAAAAAADVQVRFGAVLADLSVPDVRVDASGQYVVGANNYQLAPMDVQVIIDGIAIGNCPGSYPLRPGLHRARFQRPGLEPVELMINAREGLAISVPMQLSPEGRANWQRDAAFFNDLKNGAVLRDAELIKVRAIADFLKQSSVRIDTSNVQNLNVGGESLWWQLVP